jgi:general secretion pathway protein L
MPFGDPKKIRQTLPYEIETMVPFPIDDLVVDFTVLDRAEHSDILAASVNKALVSEYLSRLQPYGIDPEVLDIRCVPTVSWLLKQEGTPANGLFLDVGGKKNTMILYIKGRIALIRTFSSDGSGPGQPPSDATKRDRLGMPSPEGIESSLKAFCAMIQNTVHAFGWQRAMVIRPEKVSFTGPWALYPDTGNFLDQFLGMPAEQLNLRRDKRVHMDKNIAKVWDPAMMDHALALALRDDRRVRGFNFRKDEFEVKKQVLGPKKELRKAAVFLAVVLAFLAFDLGVDYTLLKKRYTVLDQKITEVFKKTFPEVTKIVDPVQQMRVKINEMKKSALLLPGMHTDEKVIDLLKDISQRVPKGTDVHVTRIVVDPDTVQISGDTDTFNTVDNLKSGLEPSSYFSNVTITSANLDRKGKRVQFDLKLQRRKRELYSKPFELDARQIKERRSL